MSDQLTQEEIDALLNGSFQAEEPSVSENPLSQDVEDIIGEVGNISMSQAATTLSLLLNRKVSITTPRVKGLTLKEIIDESVAPKVVTSIAFKKGLVGNNVLMIDVNDAIIIADLMMGNDGSNLEGKEFTELELSAVSEAMNQMIGSASTAMATMFDRRVDISPPDVEVWEDSEKLFMEAPDENEMVCVTSFHLSVEGLLESEIMQILPLDTVMEIVDIMMGDEAEVLNGRDQIVIEDKHDSQETQTETQSQASQETISIQNPKFQDLEKNTMKNAPRNLDLIMDVPLDFSVVLGKSQKTIKDVLSLSTGSVVELDKMTDEPLEIYVNGKLIAEGEVVVINESFGIRITNILSKEQRVKHLN